MIDPKYDRNALLTFLQERLLVAHDSLRAQIACFRDAVHKRPLEGFTHAQEALRAAATLDLHRRIEHLLLEVQDTQSPVTLDQMIATLDSEADTALLQGFATSPLGTVRNANLARAEVWYRAWMRGKVCADNAHAGRTFTTLRDEVLALYKPGCAPKTRGEAPAQSTPPRDPF